MSIEGRHALPTKATHRARRRAMGALAVLAVVFGFFTTISPARADQAANDDWLQRVNSFRQANGLAALAIDGQLNGLSQGRAEINARNGSLVHTPSLPAGLSEPWVKLGENIGMGPTHEMIWQAFLNSPPHRANLLDPAFTHIGIGEVVVGGTIWVTHRFMKLGSVSTPAPQAPVVVSPPVAAAPQVATTPQTTRTPTTTAKPSNSSNGSAGANPGSTGSGNGSGGESGGGTTAEAAVDPGPPAPPPNPTPNAAAVVDALRVLQQ